VSYEIRYSFAAAEHQRGLTARQRRLVLDAVERHLRHEPLVETRNRKQMRRNPVATWELRVGDLRVYYDVEETPDPVVWVDAIGVKTGSRVMIGGKVVDL